MARLDLITLLYVIIVYHSIILKGFTTLGKRSVMGLVRGETGISVVLISFL